MQHKQLCTREDFHSIIHIMPEPESVCKFKNWKFSACSPFIIYADIESVLGPIDEQSGATHRYQLHEPCSAAALLVSKVDGVSDQFRLFSGKDAVAQLLDQLIEWETRCMAHLEANKKMKPLSRAQEVAFANAIECRICHNSKGQFDDADNELRKVRDHDHITGRFLGAAHNRCNLQRAVVYEIPVFFHNFKGYDSHLIAQAIGRAEGRELKVIAQNMERYMQLKWGEHLVFRDSLQFLSQSLEKLVESLRKTDDALYGPVRTADESSFRHLSGLIGQNYEADYRLLLRKGVFPYEYIDTPAKLMETALPPIEAFRSTLRGEDCKPDDYAYAQQVWQAFGCRTLDDYMKLYLTSDVCQLADVFENFRMICFEGRYGLDPAYFVSAPHLAWNSMFKMLGLELELISDSEMYRMIAPNIRGGICHASVRMERANNRFMGARYDPSKPEKYILYVDANNLYGWAMSQALPHDDFQWLTDSEMMEARELLLGDDPWRFWDYEWRNKREMARVLAVPDSDIPNPETRSFINEEADWILEVDLEYPDHLHDLHDDYPLAPESFEVLTSMLSDKHLSLRRKYYGASNQYSRKLVCSLLSRKKYVVYGPLLRFYIEQGLVVTAVHRGIRFNTRYMLRDYIQYNTDQRNAAGNDECKRSFFKMMNNAVFGKTIEKPEKHIDIRLETDPEAARRHAEKPHCVQFRVFHEELIGVEMRKVKGVINKPFQLGYAILELSKLHMYRSFYQLKAHFGDRVRMMYTDTDSLVLSFEGPDCQPFDLYSELLTTPSISELFDLSQTPVGHVTFPTNIQHAHADQVGYFKDELKGDQIVEFIALKPKMYSFISCASTKPDDRTTMPPIKSKQVGKGIARATLKTIVHDEYKRMYNEGDGTKVINRRIASQLHQVYTQAVEKRGLVPYDDKRYLLADIVDAEGVAHPNPNTHAFGHKSLRGQVRLEEDELPQAGAEMVVVARTAAESDEEPLTLNHRMERRYVRKNNRAKKLAHESKRNNDDDHDLAADDGDEAVDVELEQVCDEAERRPGGLRGVNAVADMLFARLQGPDAQLEPTLPLPRHVVADRAIHDKQKRVAAMQETGMFNLL